MGAFTAPVWPFTAAIIFGGALAAAQFLALAGGNIARLRARAAQDAAVGRFGPVAVAVFAALCVLAVAFLFTQGWSRQGVGIFAIVGMLFLVVSGMHLATVLIILSFLGI
jgi:hypothetical protein